MDRNKPFIIITSRMQQWGQIEVFKLETLTEQDAIQFVKKGLKITNDAEMGDVKTLVRLFQNFPLALQQALAYITETNMNLHCIGSGYNIANYLNDFKEKGKILLKHECYRDMGNHSSATTYKTWIVTVDKIKRSKPYGQLASKVFNLISLFAANEINPKMFLPLTDGNYIELAPAIRLLVKYSMVNQHDCLLNVHPLVQEITFYNLKADKSEREYFQTARNLLINYFELVSNFVQRQQFVLPHLESLVSKINVWVECNSMQLKTTEQKPLLRKIFAKYICMNKKDFEQDHIFSLLQCITDGYDEFDCQKTILFLEQLISVKEKLYGLNHFEIASTLFRLGNAYQDLGKPTVQKELLERALAIREEHFGPDHFQMASTLFGLGNVYGSLGEPKMQKEYYERALAIEEKHYGPCHFETASTLFGLGNAYGSLGEPKMQKLFYESALAIKEKHYGPDHFQMASTLFGLGNAYGSLGEPKMQKEYYERAVAIEEKHYGPCHFETASTLFGLGNAYGNLGEPKMQKEYYERALAIEEKHYGPDHFEMASTLFGLGNAYGNLGEPNVQKEFYERALAIKEKHYGSDHHYTYSLTSHDQHPVFHECDPKHKCCWYTVGLKSAVIAFCILETVLISYNAMITNEHMDSFSSLGKSVIQFTVICLFHYFIVQYGIRYEKYIQKYPIRLVPHFIYNFLSIQAYFFGCFTGLVVPLNAHHFDALLDTLPRLNIIDRNILMTVAAIAIGAGFDILFRCIVTKCFQYLNDKLEFEPRLLDRPLTRVQSVC